VVLPPRFWRILYATRYVDASEEDLPKRIVCFEHNRSKFNNLTDNLKNSGLGPLINLHFSPLVPYLYQGREHLFYDCANRLSQLARLFEDREAKIFVLLNDTHTEQKPDRFAALPQLLQHLSAHSLDIVVNDVEPESGLLTQWRELLEARGLEHQAPVDFGDATAQLLKINP